MKLQMFTIFDNATKAYLPPFYMQQKGEALRAFTKSCNDEKHQFSQTPSDYTLFKVGEYDDETAVIESHAPQKIISANEVVVQEKINEAYRPINDELLNKIIDIVGQKFKEKNNE